MDYKVFDETLKEIEKKYGKETFCYFDDNDKVEVIPTGSFHLDDATGIGGFPKGRIVEIFGNESSGKTTIALQVIKECINNNMKAAYIDAEQTLDAPYLKSLGIDLEKLLIAKPETGEQAFSIIDALVKTNLIDLIVVDSVAALIPQSELNAGIEEQNIGAHARLMSKGIRMIHANIAKSNVCVVFINQLREKVGVMFGNPEITTGGRALKFFSSLRLDVRKSELLKNGSDILGIKSKVTVVKNKLAPPLKTCFVDIFFGKGFDYNNEILDFAIEYEIIDKSGSWFYYNGDKICQGRKQLEEYLNSHPEIFDEIKNKVIEQKK